MKTKHLVMAAAISLSMGASGCRTVDGVKTPRTLSLDGPIAKFSTNTFQKNLDEYTASMKAEKYDRALVLRDQMINSIRVEIEMNYREFEQTLYHGRAAFNTSADIAELALAGAATITHGETAKTVLSAILTAAKGARLSYDKNFFREKTTEAIIASMQAGRSKKLAQIIESMSLSAREYPFEKAWVDLVDFFYAGTIEGGLLALTSEAASEAEKGMLELRAVEADRIFTLRKATEKQIEGTSSLQERRSALQRANNVTEARRILAARNVAIPDGAADADIFKLLRTHIEETSNKGEREVEALRRIFDQQP